VPSINFVNGPSADGSSEDALDKPFGNRVFMPQRGGPAVVMNIVGCIQVEVAVKDVTYKVPTGQRTDGAYRCLKILPWSYSMAES